MALPKYAKLHYSTEIDLKQFTNGIYSVVRFQIILLLGTGRKKPFEMEWTILLLMYKFDVIVLIIKNLEWLCHGKNYVTSSPYWISKGHLLTHSSAIIDLPRFIC